MNLNYLFANRRVADVPLRLLICKRKYIAPLMQCHGVFLFSGGFIYILEFTLPGLPHTTNSLGRAHWTKKLKESKRWHKEIALVLKRHHIPLKPLLKAKLTLTRHSSGSCDFDGLVSSFKAIIDGLVEQHILENDKMVNIGQPIYQQSKCAKGKGFITVRVEEINSNDTV